MSKELLHEHLTEILSIYAQAFAGYPWFEQLSSEVVQERIEKHQHENGFQLVVSYRSGQIAGATWHHEHSSQGVLEQKMGPQLLAFLTPFMEERNLEKIVYVCETIVAPHFQGQGVATELKEESLTLIREAYPGGALIYTRMRDDNFGIIKINERAGFQRTGVRVPSSSNPNLFHEYWYRILSPISRERALSHNMTGM